MDWGRERLITIEVIPIRNKKHRALLKKEYPLGYAENHVFYYETVRYI